MENFRNTEKLESCGVLNISWTTSKGRDTYGYNICRLDDRQRRFKTCGGGYDMLGTVLGDWIENTFQARLQQIANRAGAHYSKAEGYKSNDGDIVSDKFPQLRIPRLYGMARNDDTGHVSLDGACGVSCMVEIAEALNVSLSANIDRKGHVVNYMFTAYSFGGL